MQYQRVTKEERMHIYFWRQGGCAQSEIARRLRKSPSTISREIKRNKGGRGYRPGQAQKKAEDRARRGGSRRFTKKICQEVAYQLQSGWTPEIISNRARHERRECVGRETIYKYIYQDAKAGGKLWMYLPRAHRRRRRRCPRMEGRGRGCIPNQRRIDERPSNVEKRKYVGHWEGDLVNGSQHTGNLVTLVERKTRFALVGRTDSKEAVEVKKVMCELFHRLPELARTGLTLDNGKEFALHEGIAKELKMDIYFAYPYHSWERGSNENVNGLIRRLYSKQSSFAHIGKSELKRIEQYLNDRPRKVLGWCTPREKMNEFMKSVRA